jgi:deazaflavin-dependent oxidoreductase (nitroreductase family)
MPNIRWLLATITTAHRFLYTVSGGRVGHRAARFHFLLLGNRGRKSGREYVTPLLYLPDGERFVVVGSNAGDVREPSWWRNLRASPATWVQVGTERVAVHAREASAAEAAALWPRFERYRRTARRRIPLVLLERAR